MVVTPLNTQIVIVELLLFPGKEKKGHACAVRGSFGWSLWMSELKFQIVTIIFNTRQWQDLFCNGHYSVSVH